MRQELLEYAYSKAPEEACGFILSEGFLPLDNIALDKINTFKINPHLYLRHKKVLKAIFHSHPMGTEPSIEDKRACNAGTVPWIILSFPDTFNIIYPTGYTDRFILC